jgi:hypothetical protein
LASQPVDPQPTPYVLGPTQAGQSLAVDVIPAPSPGLGLTPGAGNPRWDISVDALWLARDLGRGVPLGYTGYNRGSHAPQAVPTDGLWSDDVWFPLEPGIRLQLVGRLSDRTAIEATAFGLQDWTVGRTIYGDPVGQTVLGQSRWLQVPYFDNTLGYTYSSQVANVELNQRIKFMSLDPYQALSWLWGVRYFHLSDDFTLSGSDLYTGDEEFLNWQTKNNLIGMQLGLQWAWGWERFQLSTEAKVGLFANAYSQQGTDLSNGVAGFEPFGVSHSGTELSALFEFSLLLRYRVTPCMWIRGGYQYYGVTGLALSPRQLGGYDAGGGVSLDGLSLGVELTR